MTRLDLWSLYCKFTIVSGQREVESLEGDEELIVIDEVKATGLAQGFDSISLLRFG